MSVVTNCDRCGKRIDRRKRLRAMFKPYMYRLRGPEVEYYHLCPDCGATFKDWMKQFGLGVPYDCDEDEDDENWED